MLYTLTAYDKDGTKRLDTTFEATSDTAAKEQGEKKLREENLYHHTHRCTSAAGKLILFQR